MWRANGWAYPVAVGLAEGGWIAVVYVLIDAMAGVPTQLGLAVFAAVAATTCRFAERVDRLAGMRIAIVVALLAGGGLIGLVLASAVSALAAVGGAGGAGGLAGIDPTRDSGAVILGLAALRGFLRAGTLRDPSQASRPLFLGLLGLSAVWIFAGALDPAARATFHRDALVPTVGFLVGGIAATGLARSGLVGVAAGFDPRSNRAWLAVLIGVAALVGTLALPLGSATERLMAAIIAWPLTVPALVAGAILARLIVPSRGGVVRTASSHALGLGIVLGVMVLISLVLPPPAPSSGEAGGAASTGTAAEPTSSVFDVVLVGLVLAAVAATLLYLARAWRSRADGTDPRVGGDARDRVESLPDDDAGGGLRLSRWLRRVVDRRGPTDAVTAYLAALRTLSPHEGLARTPNETPAAHARRLHDVGAGTLELDLLAADYELARWGGRSISRTEDRRAIGRWERLRRRLAEDPPEGRP